MVLPGEPKLRVERAPTWSGVLVTSPSLALGKSHIARKRGSRVAQGRGSASLSNESKPVGAIVLLYSLRMHYTCTMPKLLLMVASRVASVTSRRLGFTA